MDSNGDGQISLTDVEEVFSSYGGGKVNDILWEQMLAEADKNGDGMVSENEFEDAMQNMIRASIKKVPKKPVTPS